MSQSNWTDLALAEFADARAELQRPTALIVSAEAALREALNHARSQIAIVRSERATELRTEERAKRAAEEKVRAEREAKEKRDRSALKRILEAELERRRLLATLIPSEEQDATK